MFDHDYTVNEGFLHSGLQWAKATVLPNQSYMFHYEMLRGLGAYFLVINLKIILSRRCFVEKTFPFVGRGAHPNEKPKVGPRIHPTSPRRPGFMREGTTKSRAPGNAIGCTKAMFLEGRSIQKKKMPI